MERFLFRVGEEVVSLNDLMQAEKDIAALHCRFDDSLFLAHLGDKFSVQLHQLNSSLEDVTKSIRDNKADTVFLTRVRQNWKLLSFVDTQDVALTPQLEDATKAVSGCPPITDTAGKMRSSFRRWLRAEIYLRSRYGGSDHGSSKKEAMEKRLQSVGFFLETLEKQVSHEDFW